jgi:NitT/TauT family transport system ATP-binding protein
MSNLADKNVGGIGGGLMSADEARIAANMGGPALVVEKISKRFDTNGGPIFALEDLSFEVRSGEFFSIIGPSGCGKSTLFKIIGGLIDEYDGCITVDSQPVRGSHRSIGMVFQEESTFPWRTTLENVAFPLQAAGMPKADRLKRARELVRLVGLEGFENHYPAQLSGGMRQRTAMARTLAFSPRILLMDEPFAALDEQTRLLLGDKVLQIQQKLRQTTLLITHNIAEAVQLSDRVLIMSYRPGRLKRLIDIDLPRPRSSEILGSQQFGHYVAALWSDLREEASKGLSADEAAMGTPEKP